MTNIKTREMVYNLRRHLLFGKFLKDYNINGTLLSDYLERADFFNALQCCIESNDFKTRSIYSLFEPLIFELCEFVDYPNLLDHIHLYVVNLNFPETEIFDAQPKLERAAACFLKIMKVFCDYQKSISDGTWQSLYPITHLTIDEEHQLEHPEEYQRFKKAFVNDYVYEMMKINQDLLGYTTLDHVCGVHHLAVKVARQLKGTGIPVDLGRVSGAAAGHDVGKYGCKGPEKRRVAYFHYHYTGVWFEKRDITYIRHIAINHSTWDLELENLPVEALILIYADFRVKADDDGKMTFYTLQDSFQVILDKLDNVDEAKEQRYKKVYSKLKDFEDFMISLGVEVSPDLPISVGAHVERERIHYSLLQGENIIANAKNLSIEHNLKLMHLLRDENSLNRLLESARSMKNVNDLRGYIDILEDYSTYLTQKQKHIAVNFLYGLLVSPEEDIRKQCSQLIGNLIGGFDEVLRKEIPEGAVISKFEIESLELLKKVTEKVLTPDRHIIGKHRHWVSYSLKGIFLAYFNTQTNMDKRLKSIELLLEVYQLHDPKLEQRTYLLHGLRGVPIELLNVEQSEYVKALLLTSLNHADQHLRISTLNALSDILKHPEPQLGFYSEIEMALRVSHENTTLAEEYSRQLMFEKLGCGNRIQFIQALCDKQEMDLSSLFLSNLKSATYDLNKKFQVKLLVDYAIYIDPANTFYTAMHLCNLLKVSALEAVRNTAGESLVNLAETLSFEQKNDIVVELLRALEMENFQFTRYIPDYLGQLLLQIQPIELDEIIEDFRDKIKKSNAQIGMLIMKTVGVVIRHYHGYGDRFGESDKKLKERTDILLGILLNGFVSFIPAITQSAMTVLGKEVFNEEHLNLIEKRSIFDSIIKKLLSLIKTTDEAHDLIFMSNSAGLKYIYRFIGEYYHVHGVIEMPTRERVAFFPGSFDPFSLSHKQIAKEIRDLGFEVYLAVDEFSWSKRTQPNLIRRDIIKMSIADEIDIYSFPRDVSVNIGNTEDLKLLKTYFPDSEIFMVVGSDVIVNASAYKGEPKLDSVATMPHIVFERREEDASVLSDNFDKIYEKMNSKSIRLLLPSQYEMISSTQIRNYIDWSRDISELVDPLAQRYIYEKGLYQREPQFKEVMTTKSTSVEIVDRLTESLIHELLELVEGERTELLMTLDQFIKKESSRVIILRSAADSKQIMGFAYFHWLRSSQIFSEFTDEVLMDHVREKAVGRILIIDGIYVRKDAAMRNARQVVLTETLAHSLARDYTYAVYRDAFHKRIEHETKVVLENQGFLRVESKEAHETIFTVNMSDPVTLNLDIKSLIKEPYRSIPEVKAAIYEARQKLQRAICALYPGHLVLSFDRGMVYENLINKICEENQMPITPFYPKINGTAMCVPFGDVFKRWILPNTVTKAIHVEKYFYPDLETYRIEAYPYYLDLDNQMKMLKSFNRPVLMVDDILDKGYRIKVLEPAIRKHGIPLQKVFVGILSGRGKALMESKNIEVDSAYFIPRLRVWFNEGKLYPYLGGDAVWRGYTPERNMIPSVNLILPYASPAYIRGASNETIYQLSEVVIENAMSILRVIENQYQTRNDRMLTFARLGEVCISPRHPDKGRHLKYDVNRKVTEYLEIDLETLKKLKKMYHTE